MKLNNKLSPLLVLILSALACNSIQQINSASRELPTESPSLLEPSTPTSSPKNLVWKVLNSVEVNYDPDLWLLESDTELPQESPLSRSLLSLNINDCRLGLHSATEYPEGWSVTKENITLGEFPTQRARFIDEKEETQYIIYYYDFVEFFLSTGENWQSCSMEAEKVLSTLHNSESPSGNQLSQDGITYQEPAWIITIKDNGVSEFTVETVVKNNNNKPTRVLFSFKLYKPNGEKLAECMSSRGAFNVPDIISSNGTARLQCSADIYEKLNEAKFDSYKLVYDVENVTPLNENKPDDIEVLETGIETKNEQFGDIPYTVYARIQSKSDQHVTVRYYILNSQGMQIVHCESYDELRPEIAIRTQCFDPLFYKTDDSNQIPASVIVDVIKQ